MKQRGGFLDRILHEADEDIENFLCWQTRALPKLRKPSIIPTTHLADSTNRLHNRQQKTVIKRVNSAQSIDSLQSSGSWKSKVKQPTETASLPGRLWASGLNIA